MTDENKNLYTIVIYIGDPNPENVKLIEEEVEGNFKNVYSRTLYYLIIYRKLKVVYLKYYCQQMTFINH